MASTTFRRASEQTGAPLLFGLAHIQLRRLHSSCRACAFWRMDAAKTACTQLPSLAGRRWLNSQRCWMWVSVQRLFLTPRFRVVCFVERGLPARCTRAEGLVIDCDGYVGISRQLNAHLLCVHTRCWRSRCAKVKCSVESEGTLVLFDLTTKSAKKLLGVPPAAMELGPCSAALQETAAPTRSVV